jgi:hypothetical protein
LQYEKASESDTFSTWAEKIYNALAANYHLATGFEITLAAAEGASRAIRFDARDYGDRNIITYTAGDATGIAQATQSDGTEPELRENFGIVASLWQNDVKEAEEIKPVDSTGRATFDLSDYLMSLIDADARFTWPEVSGTNTYQRSDYLLAYRVSLAEKYSGTVRKMTFGEEVHAIGGGLSRETLMRLNEDSEEFFGVAANKQKFLTWSPPLREIGTGIFQKLFFAFQDPTDDYTQWRPVCTVLFENGSVQTIYPAALASITPWSVVEIIVGYDHLGLGLLNPTSAVVRWHISLQNELYETISEVKAFQLDSDFYENERQFLFRNSFSAYDIVRFTGQMEMTAEFERQVGNRVITDEVTGINAPGRMFLNTETQNMKTSSGWIPLAEKKHLRDMLLSREVYEIIDGKLYPIVIKTSKAQQMLSDAVTLHSLEIEYERAYNDTFWSEVPAAEEAAALDRNYSDDYNPIEYS